MVNLLKIKDYFLNLETFIKTTITNNNKKMINSLENLLKVYKK